MAAPVDLNAILKRVQAEFFKDDALVRKSDFMKYIAHKKDFHGITFNFSVQASGYGGASHDVAVADANDVNGVYKEFVVPSISDYRNGKLDGATTRKVLEGGVNEQYINYMKQEIKNAYGSLEARLARGAFRTGTGARGTISAGSTVASPTITFTNPSDALYIAVGDKLVASAADGGALRNSGLTTTAVTAVDTATGTVTITGNFSATITAIQPGDTLYVAGDAQNGASVPKSWLGVQAWAPNSTPSATLFCNVDRTISPEMLAGMRYAGTGTNVETTLIGAEAYAQSRPGFSVDDHVIVMSKIDFANLQIAKEGSRIVDMKSEQYGIGIDAFSVGGQKVISDVFCPDGKYFLVGKDAFSLHTNAGVTINKTDGNQIQRQAGDTYQFQVLVDGQFIATNPAAILNGTWPSV